MDAEGDAEREAEASLDGSRLARAERTFAFLAALFAAVLVLTNIVGVKLFQIFPTGRPAWLPGEGPLTLTAGILTYPLTFLMTDVVSELWGRRRASFLVLVGFLMSLVMLVVVWAARVLAPSPYWENPVLGLGSGELQRAFDATFFYPGLLLFASMTAYLVAQLLDVRLYHLWWRLTGGGHMWIRNNGSTALSQLVDTIIVNGIYLRFGLRMDWEVIAEIIAAVYLCKLVLALLDTPLIYATRALLRSYFGLPAGAAPQRAPLA